MEELVIAMKKALADSFAFYLKTHGFHWNVTGPDFYEYHKLLEVIYEEVYGSVDRFGEEIRALGDYAPASFSRFVELTVIQDQTKIPPAMSMIDELLADNAKVMDTVHNAYELAESAHQHGLSNFLAERLDAHKKHAWMLSATAKK